MSKQEEFNKAVENNNTEEVKILLKNKKVDPAYNYNDAIYLSSKKGYIEIVKLLLSDLRVDPSDDDNYAIRWAIKNRHIKIVKLLFNNLIVRNSLKKDDEELYNELIKQEISEKISNF